MRYVVKTDLMTGDTYVYDTEQDVYAWFGDIPEHYVTGIAEKMSTEDGYADKYAWVTAEFDLVRGP